MKSCNTTAGQRHLSELALEHLHLINMQHIMENLNPHIQVTSKDSHRFYNAVCTLFPVYTPKTCSYTNELQTR